MKLKIINCDFAVCKINNISSVNFDDEICFLSKTDEEISLVCRSDFVPFDAVIADKGWKAFRIEGILDFSLIGILSEISTVLAENKIGIFAISTYNTDYILVKENNFSKALKALENKGYEIIE